MPIDQRCETTDMRALTGNALLLHAQTPIAVWIRGSVVLTDSLASQQFVLAGACSRDRVNKEGTPT